MESLTIESLAEILKKRHRQFQLSKASIGIVITDNCPVACRHCISNNRPNSADEIELTTLKTRVDKITELKDFELITITGGEPFFVFEKLLSLVDYINQKGLKSSVVTSAYWANSVDTTINKLKKLQSAGLYAISISTDIYHQEKVPLQNIINVVKISNELGLIYSIAFTKSGNRENDENLLASIENSLPESEFKELRISKGELINSGRAYINKLFYESDNPSASTLICQSMGKLVRSDGQLALCCGADLPESSPLLAGNIDESKVSVLQKKMNENYLVPFIETIGFRRIIDLLNKEFGDLKVLDHDRLPYNLCNLCIKILSCKKYQEFLSEQINEPGIEKSIKNNYLLFYGCDYQNQ